MDGIQSAGDDPRRRRRALRLGRLADRLLRLPGAFRDGRQHRPDVGARGAGLRPERGRGRLWDQGLGRPSAARPPAPADRAGRRPRLPVRLAGLALSAAVALAFAGPWLRDMKRTGLTRENYRGRSLAFPAGAVLARLLAGGPGAAGAARRSRRSRPARPGAAALGGLRARGGAARAARRRARPRRGGGGPARLARPCRRRCSRGGSRPGRSRASERWRSPPTPSPGGGARASTTSPTWRCCS